MSKIQVLVHTTNPEARFTKLSDHRNKDWMGYEGYGDHLQPTVVKSKKMSYKTKKLPDLAQRTAAYFANSVMAEVMRNEQTDDSKLKELVTLT